MKKAAVVIKNGNMALISLDCVAEWRNTVLVVVRTEKRERKASTAIQNTWRSHRARLVVDYKRGERYRRRGRRRSIDLAAGVGRSIYEEFEVEGQYEIRSTLEKLNSKFAELAVMDSEGVGSQEEILNPMGTTSP